MRKVLHLITGLERGGGAEAMLLKTVPYLEKTENAVCVLKGRGEIGAELEQAGIKVFYLDMKGKTDFRAIFRYRSVLKEFEPDLQVNYLIHADMVGRIFGNIFRVPRIIAYIRNRHAGKKVETFEKITQKQINYLLTNSEANLHYYREKYGIPNEKSRCISNGVPIPKLPEESDRLKIRKKLGFAPETPLIISTSRLIAQKRLDMLLYACQKLVEKGSTFHLLLLNDGEDFEALSELSNKLELTEHVSFLGKRRDLGELLGASDIFVLPSEKEGMSNALLEAMSYELAPVVSSIPENTEIVKNEENGFTFTLGDAEELAEKLMKLAEDRERRSSLGKSARKTIQEKYDIIKIRKDLDEFLYEQAQR